MILTRISGYSTICREEQHPYCTPTFNHSPNSSIAGLDSIVIEGMLMLGVVYMIFKLLSKSKKDVFHSFRYILPIGFLLVFIYWTLDTFQAHGMGEEFHPHKIWIARLGFPVWSLIAIIGFIQIWKQKSNEIGFGYFLFTSVLLIHLLMVQKPMGGAMLLLGYIQLGLLIEMVYIWRDKAILWDVSLKKAHSKESNFLFLNCIS